MSGNVIIKFRAYQYQLHTLQVVNLFQRKLLLSLLKRSTCFIRFQEYPLLDY